MGSGLFQKIEIETLVSFALLVVIDTPHVTRFGLLFVLCSVPKRSVQDEALEIPLTHQ